LKNKTLIKKMDVKPKFLKIMKQKNFTLIMMLALVILTGSAFAAGTKAAPENNETYTYSWDGIATLSTSSFIITTANPATIPTSSSTATDNYTAASEVTTGTTRSIDITWLNGSIGVPYHVWIKVDNALGCSNYRYFNVTPVAAVVFTLYAQGVDDNTPTITFGQTYASGNSCSVPEAPIWLEGSDNEGNTYVYFEVVRTNGTTGAWEFTFTDGAVGTIQACATSTGTYAAIGTPQSVPGTSNTYYVRVIIPVPVGATATTINGLISGAREVSPVYNDAGGSNTASYTANPLPAIGTFN
jgi:hypothetical protein